MQLSVERREEEATKATDIDRIIEYNIGFKHGNWVLNFHSKFLFFFNLGKNNYSI